MTVSIIRERATNKIVIGGGEDASGKFHPRTPQQRNLELKNNEKNNSMAIRWRYQRDW